MAIDVAQVEREIDEALRIAGAEDYSDTGGHGGIEVQGVFANAIMAELLPAPEAREQFCVVDQPVRISRECGLEAWCNGFYVEGRGVRGAVHRAARAVRGSLGIEPTPTQTPAGR